MLYALLVLSVPFVVVPATAVALAGAAGWVFAVVYLVTLVWLLVRP